MKQPTLEQCRVFGRLADLSRHRMSCRVCFYVASRLVATPNVLQSLFLCSRQTCRNTKSLEELMFLCSRQTCDDRKCLVDLKLLCSRQTCDDRKCLAELKLLCSRQICDDRNCLATLSFYVAGRLVTTDN